MSYIIHINHSAANGGPRDHIIRTVEEAESEGVKYVHWMEANEGEYCLTDDDYVAEVLKVKLYGAAKSDKITNKYVKCAFGYIMYNLRYPNTKFKAEGRSNNHSFSGKPDMQVMKGREKVKNLAMAYAQTMDKDLAIDICFPGGIDTSKRGTLRRKMKSQEFREMVREEVKQLLLDSELTEKYTMNLLKDAIEMAKDKFDVKSLLVAVKNLEELHGMINKDKTVTTQQIEGTSTRNLIDQIGVESRKFNAKQVVVEPCQ